MYLLLQVNPPPPQNAASIVDNPNYREQEALINKSIHLFGSDVNQLSFFDFEKEKVEIKNDTWKGRIWKFATILFYLHKNDGAKCMCLQIGPFNANNQSKE